MYIAEDKWKSRAHMVGEPFKGWGSIPQFERHMQKVEDTEMYNYCHLRDIFRGHKSMTVCIQQIVFLKTEASERYSVK